MSAALRPAVACIAVALSLPACQQREEHPGAVVTAPGAASAPSAPSASTPARTVTPGTAGTASPSAPSTSTAAAPDNPARTAGAGAAPDFTELVKRVGPAVVNVATVATRSVDASMQGIPGISPDDPLFEFFRRFLPQQPGQGQPREYRAQGVGSGFVIDANGEILTNAHVVQDADEVTVRLPGNDREYKAKVVGSDRQTDVALLKVDAKGLPVMRLGKAEDVEAGQWVAAIGSPFGLANTITAGIVSATERALPNEVYVPFIQTDVAVNPGNSGGPLLNTRGEVIGINSMIYSRTGGYMGVSFAIPIDTAVEVANQLRSKGHVTRGRIGVGIQDVSADLAASFGLDKPRGALVTTVEPNGPAQKAGVQPGDVIVRFAGQDVNEAGDLPRLVARAEPGKDVTLDVWRGGASRELKATVGEMPSQRTAQASPQRPSKGDDRSAGKLGLTVAELPPAGRRQLGVNFGLVVQDIEGVNERSPLAPGDVIVGIGPQRFSSLDEFTRRLNEAKAGDTLALLVRRGEASLFVPVTVG